MASSGEKKACLKTQTSMTTRQGEPVNRMKHYVVLYRSFLIAPCVGILMLGIGVNLDYVSAGLQSAVSDAIFYFALTIFIVEFVLEVIYGDRREPFFKCRLVFHGLVTLVLYGLLILTLTSSHLPEVQALQQLRLIALLRVADIFALIHRYQTKMATEALQSRRAFAMLLLQAFYSAFILAYFVAILLRVKSISFGDNQFQSASGTFLLMLPLSLLFSTIYVILSFQVAKIKDSCRTSFIKFEEERVLDNEESDEEAPTAHISVTRSLEALSTSQSTFDNLKLGKTHMQGTDMQHGPFEAEVAESFSGTEEGADAEDVEAQHGVVEAEVAESFSGAEEGADAQDVQAQHGLAEAEVAESFSGAEEGADAEGAEAPYGFVNANPPFPEQDEESCVFAELPDPLQSHETMPVLVGLSEAIAASKAGEIETKRLVL